MAVITRTKDRPVLLRRAAKSIADQTYRDYIWVVVNDGGDPDEVNRTVELSDVPRDQVRIVTHNSSRGMEAASNAGISACESEFVAIHDDDDSWDPRFLAETTGVLTGDIQENFGGVVTGSTREIEEIQGNDVVPVNSSAYLPTGTSIGLADLLRCNQFPPICFLYRRRWWEKIGGYNEQLEVLGDWAFNLDFIVQANIAVLPKQLAHYHVRRPEIGEGSNAAPTPEVYLNSVTKDRRAHELTASLVVNDFLRRALGRGNALTAMLGALVQDAHQRLRENGLDPEFPQPDWSTPGSSLAPTAPRPMIDDYDRCWTTLHFNESLRQQRKRMRPSALMTDFLSPRDGWEQVKAAIGRAGIAIEPPRDFDTPAYLRRFPDVASAVALGEMPSAYMHYLLHGREEGRTRFAKVTSQ